MKLCVLGSGSAGNASVVVPDGDGPLVMLDAGLSPRRTVERMTDAGLDPDALRHIVLTHLDHDHFHPGWIKPIRERRLAVHVHLRHRNRAVHRGVDGRRLELFSEVFTPEAGLIVDPHLFAHDNLGTVGFVIECDGARLGYATDLGHVPSGFADHFDRLDALAIESNYDPELQRASGRPVFLQQRIMNGRGHLSNAQSLDAVRQVAERSSLGHVVALHLSRECNTPDHLRKLYAKQAPKLAPRLTISSQHRATQLIEIKPKVVAGQQMTLQALWSV